MKEIKSYWLWEKEEFYEPIEKLKDKVEFYRYKFELSQSQFISEDTTLLFKMIDKRSGNIFFLTGTLFCVLDIEESFKTNLLLGKDKNKKIIESDEVSLNGSNFKFQELKGYLYHYYYFENYKLLPFTEPNNEYFDDGLIDTSIYGFLGIYKLDELNELINNYINKVLEIGIKK